MNSHSVNRISGRFYLMCAVVAAMLLFASVGQAFGQDRSRDPNNPTRLKVKTIPVEVTDDLDGSDDAFFYQVFAGPGKLRLHFEVTATGTNAGAILKLIDSGGKPILSNILAQGVDGGTERVVRTVPLGRAQLITISIKGIRYGDSGGNGVYKITLGGALQLTKD